MKHKHEAKFQRSKLGFFGYLRGYSATLPAHNEVDEKRASGTVELISFDNECKRSADRVYVTWYLLLLKYFTSEQAPKLSELYEVLCSFQVPKRLFVI